MQPMLLTFIFFMIEQIAQNTSTNELSASPEQFLSILSS